MKLWISRIFLVIGIVLLMFHNIVAHYHHDDYDDHIAHHDNDALEHANVDHIFSPQIYHFEGLQALVPSLIYTLDYHSVLYPVTLPVQPVIPPDEPYPPGWATGQTILRGPPINC